MLELESNSVLQGILRIEALAGQDMRSLNEDLLNLLKLVYVYKVANIVIEILCEGLE